MMDGRTAVAGAALHAAGQVYRFYDPLQSRTSHAEETKFSIDYVKGDITGRVTGDIVRIAGTPLSTFFFFFAFMLVVYLGVVWGLTVFVRRNGAIWDDRKRHQFFQLCSGQRDGAIRGHPWTGV